MFLLCTSDQQEITLFGDHLMNIPTKFVSNWPQNFREEDQNVRVDGRQRQQTMTRDDYIPHMTLLGQMNQNTFIKIGWKINAPYTRTDNTIFDTIRRLGSYVYFQPTKNLS